MKPKTPVCYKADALYGFCAIRLQLITLRSKFSFLGCYPELRHSIFPSTIFCDKNIKKQLKFTTARMIKSDGTGRQTLPRWHDPSRKFLPLTSVRRPRFEKPCFRKTPLVIFKTFLTYHNRKGFKENPFLG